MALVLGWKREERMYRFEVSPGFWVDVGEGEKRWGILVEGWERGDTGLFIGLLRSGRLGC
jgi:hypothetical protein